MLRRAEQKHQPKHLTIFYLTMTTVLILCICIEIAGFPIGRRTAVSIQVLARCVISLYNSPNKAIMKRLKFSAAEQPQSAAPTLAAYFPSGQQQQPPEYSIYETRSGRGTAYTVIGKQVRASMHTRVMLDAQICVSTVCLTNYPGNYNRVTQNSWGTREEMSTHQGPIRASMCGFWVLGCYSQ